MWRLFARRRPGTGPGHPDGGFTLIEVVVAMAIFAIMVPATLGVVTKTTQGVQENRSRVVAASLAARDIDAARALNLTSLSFSTAQQTVGNVVYTITRTVSAATATGTSSSCATLTPAVAYALVSVAVSWPQMGSIKPVRADTLLRATSPGTGALAVTVTGSSGQVVSGIPVTLSNGTTITTDASGCALFSNLSPGSYTATLNSSGYVGPGGAQLVTSPPATVVANDVTKVTMTYDLQMTLTVNYTRADGTAVTAAEASQIPAEFRTGSVTSSTSTTTTSLPGSTTGLFPASYTVKSGTANACTLGIKDMSGGSPSSQTLNVPTATVGVTNLTTFAAIGDIVAIYEGPTAGSGAITCPIGTTIRVGTVFSIFGSHTVQLPLGQWRLQFPWNPLGFIPIPGLTVICSDISLSITSLSQLLIDVGNLIAAVIGGFLTGGGCT